MARFGGSNPRAQAQVAQIGAELVGEITEDAAFGIRRVISEGIRDGRGAMRVARDLVGRIEGNRRTGGLIGLHSQQMEWIQTARAELADPERMRNYLTRNLRDRRFDSTVRKAIAEGRALTQPEIDRLAGRMADRALIYRGRNIARTEVNRAYNAGRDEGMQQLIDGGEISADQVTKVWSSTGDGRTRNSHMDMHGQSVGRSEPFTTPNGHRLNYPGDTSMGAPGSETIQCRCTYSFKIDRYSGLT